MPMIIPHVTVIRENKSQRMISSAVFKNGYSELVVALNNLQTRPSETGIWIIYSGL